MVVVLKLKVGVEIEVGEDDARRDETRAQTLNRTDVTIATCSNDCPGGSPTFVVSFL